MNILSMSQENRPRERLERDGPQVLSNAELLALILKSGTRKENVIDLSQKLLSKYGLEKLPMASIHDLSQEHGIGRAKASQMVALFELYKRIPRMRETKPQISSARDVFNLYHSLLADMHKEQFRVLYLDTKHRLMGDETITTGILNASLVHPREVYQSAIQRNAHSIIVIHNHPSGDPCPSEEDLQVTEVLAEAGEIIGIPLVDHVIIANRGYWSWKEKNI